MAYGDFKDLKFAKKLKYDGCQRGLASMIYKFLDNKTASLIDISTSGEIVKMEIISNKELTKELHKPIIRKFDKKEVHSSFIDNIWSTDLANMHLISKFNNNNTIILLICNNNTITNTFQQILDESNHKPNKIWVEKCSEFHNRSRNSFLQKDDIEMYLIHNEGNLLLLKISLVPS